MGQSKTYSGFNQKTAENLLLDAGAFFVNLDPATENFDDAVTAGKLLGATRGGGKFTAIPKMRTIEIDGVKGAAKGLQVIDAWEVKMLANVLEVTVEGISKALTASEVDTVTNAVYEIIKAKNYIALTDYIDNITWVGKLSGTTEPAIIQVYNALNSNGLTLQTQDKAESVIAMEFMGHYASDDLDNPPFAIYYPKAQGIITGTVTELIGAVATPVSGATVTLTAGTTTVTATTAADGTYTLLGVPYGTYTVTANKDAKTGTALNVVVVAGQTTANVAIAIA